MLNVVLHRKKGNAKRRVQSQPQLPSKLKEKDCHVWKEGKKDPGVVASDSLESRLSTFQRLSALFPLLTSARDESDRKEAKAKISCSLVGKGNPSSLTAARGVESVRRCVL
jgi:hypothetical protein